MFGGNNFSSNSTKTILSTITDHPSYNLRLTHLNLAFANFDADESVEKLADILQLARSLIELDISNQKGSRKVKVVIVYATG